MIGYHLEQSYRYRSELAPVGERERALATRAALRLAPAGMRAFERRDIPAASDLLGRAAALLPRADAERRHLLLALGEVLSEAGDLKPAEAALDEAETLAEEAGDAASAANAGILRLVLLEATDPQRLSDASFPEAERFDRDTRLAGRRPGPGARLAARRGSALEPRALRGRRRSPCSRDRPRAPSRCETRGSRRARSVRRIGHVRAGAGRGDRAPVRRTPGEDRGLRVRGTCIQGTRLGPGDAGPLRGST